MTENTVTIVFNTVPEDCLEIKRKYLNSQIEEEIGFDMKDYLHPRLPNSHD